MYGVASDEVGEEISRCEQDAETTSGFYEAGYVDERDQAIVEQPVSFGVVGGAAYPVADDVVRVDVECLAERHQAAELLYQVMDLAECWLRRRELSFPHRNAALQACATASQSSLRLIAAENVGVVLHANASARSFSPIALR